MVKLWKAPKLILSHRMMMYLLWTSVSPSMPGEVWTRVVSEGPSILAFNGSLSTRRKIWVWSCLWPQQIWGVV